MPGPEGGVMRAAWEEAAGPRDTQEGALRAWLYRVMKATLPLLMRFFRTWYVVMRSPL